MNNKLIIAISSVIVILLIIVIEKQIYKHKVKKQIEEELVSILKTEQLLNVSHPLFDFQNKKE